MSHCHNTGDQSVGSGAPLRSTSLEQRTMWRSLDEVAGSPEFDEYLHREFPSQLAVWDDPQGRRSFLKLMAASLALAGIGGCARSPDEKIVPYVKAPEEQVEGKALFYATAMSRGGYGYGILAESHQGRPAKIEGNPEHPWTHGGTDVFMQASILGLYDPDRSQTVVHQGTISTWDQFVRTMAREMAAYRRKRGRGLYVLTEEFTSPTLASQLNQLLKQMPDARWHCYSPTGNVNALKGAELAFGKPVDTIYHFDQAQVILSLDSDFLADSPSSLHYARDFIDGRRVVEQPTQMNRLYVAEATYTITGAAADHRIPLAPSQIGTLAHDLWQHLQPDSHSTSQKIRSENVSEAWFQAVVQDLKEHRGSSLIVPGAGQSADLHALCHAINGLLGNLGKTVTYVNPVIAKPSGVESDLKDLVREMEQGRVDTLVILGGNPAYNAPGVLKFRELLGQVRNRIHLSAYQDETSFLCDWHIPEAHFLESWSDIRSADGTASIVQPLIAPLYEGKSIHELLNVLAGQPAATAYETILSHWQRTLQSPDFGSLWQKALHDGYLAGSQPPPVDVRLSVTPSPTLHQVSSSNGAEHFEIELRPDPSVWDGQYANNAWLQELPKPLTKITWDNVAAISPQAAATLNLKNGDVVEITVGSESIEAPVWIAPGQADTCVSMTLGYGRTRCGRVGTDVGYNAYRVLPQDAVRYSSGTIRKTGTHHLIATTQHHHSMEGREIVRITPYAGLLQDQPKSNHAENSGHEITQNHEPLSLYPGFSYEGNAWGMVIDQTACIGCNACVVACQAENNVPVVGKEQVAVGREMHWLRIDRYFHGEPEHPDAYFQPMMCVHCENAPCEVVCPVAATVHDSEGTSNMIYNRCVGTRYCSNNCPYKVRRFNYLQFSDETTGSLKLARNPEVTVRSRGVMEKCSYCIQRISAARIESKVEGLLLVPDDRVVTACQQACPTRAITFGNLNDQKSYVKQLKSSSLNYSVLSELNTFPRTSYLARVVNPHPDLDPADVSKIDVPDQTRVAPSS